MAKQKHGRPLSLMCAVLVAPFVLTLDGAATASQSRRAVSTSAAVVTAAPDGEVDTRARFGLRTDVPTLQAARLTGLTALGVAVTAAEVLELRRRDDLAVSLARIEATMIEEWPDAFGGAWVDHAAGGVVVVATRGQDTDVAKSLTQLLPDVKLNMTVKPVQYSLLDLQQLFTRINGDEIDWHSRGVDFAGISLLPIENRVRLRAASDTSDEELSGLQKTYTGSGIDVIRAAPDDGLKVSRGTTTGPLYAGNNIVAPVTGGEYRCTAASPAVGGSTGLYYGITAGHCGNAMTWHQGTGTGNTLGPDFNGDNGFKASSLASPTSCDCVDFGAITGKQTNSLIWTSGNLTNHLNWASVASNYAISRIVCSSGAVSNLILCDQIRSVSATQTGTEFGHTGKTVNMIEMYCDNRSGDSGAPITADATKTWMGVLAAGTTGSHCGTTDGTDSTLASRVQYLPSVTNDTPALPAE